MEDVMDKPTTSPISTRKHGDVLIVLSNNPPVNALGAAVRQGLVAAIEQAEADDSVKAVVIACEGPDLLRRRRHHRIRQAAGDAVAAEVVDTIENCSKPVVAAIHGTALGGGLEVALGCHYRVAVPSAKLGTPEVKLGLLPGRRRDAAAAARGRSPQGAGNVRDRQSDRRQGGVRLRPRRPADRGRADPARGRLCRGSARRPSAAEDRRERQDKLNECDPAVFDEFRKENARQVPRLRCAAKNIEAVKVACEKPYAEGVIEERKLFMELMSGTQARGAAIFLLRRAQGEQDRGPARGHRAAADQARRRDRRRAPWAAASR